MKKLLFIVSFILLNEAGFTQAHRIRGKVMDASNNQGLPGATLLIPSQDQAALSDVKGDFIFNYEGGFPFNLIISYVGFLQDTILVKNAENEVSVRLFASAELKEAEIIARRQSTEISTLQPHNIEFLNEGELLKAACCNLAESFETNPSVDVNYSDAVTGAREIQLLGLSGIYTLMMGEAIPTLRGLATAYGLMYIPGSWMESIQITKGVGSVSHGYEGMSGQINIEYKKPLKDQPLLHLNMYGDAFGRGELNTIYTMPLKRNWNYMFMGHTSGLNNKFDHNKDGFIDMPLFRQLNVYNRFHYNIKNKVEGQLGLKALMENRSGGNMNFNEAIDKFTTRSYGFKIDTRRLEVYSKTGVVFESSGYKSMGIQLSGTLHDQNSFFGLTSYTGAQYSLYANYIFMSIIGTTDHKFKTGLDFKYDFYDESVNDSSFSRKESVPGAYFEYTYGCDEEKFGAIAGARADYHNMFGWFFTPRLNLKYNFLPDLILRASAGKAYRTPNTYSDNVGLFVSAKQLLVIENPKLEEAWNGGLNMTARFRLNGKEGSFMLDAYHTIFNNQWIADQFSSPSFVYYYNLKGESSASSLQGTLTYEPLLGLVLKAAWRMDDVKTDYLELPSYSKPLLAKNKALFNAAFTDGSEKWRLDATIQWEGPKPLPLQAAEEHAGHEEQHTISKSPDYFQLMAQVTRVFKIWELYIGGENLLDYTQHTVINGAGNPFGSSFDATRVWGPVMGRRVYAGIRLNINSKQK